MHLAYMVMRLLVRKRSGVWPEVKMRAWVRFPRSKSEAAMA